MESMVNEDEEEGEGDNITFLYTLGDGACPKSFGINVARLANLPDEVLENAKRISHDFEQEMIGGTRGHAKLTPERAAEIENQIRSMICEGRDVEAEKIWEGLQKE